MYQVIQLTVHTTKRRWRMQNRRRLCTRQRPGVSLFAGAPLLHRLPKLLLRGRVSTPILISMLGFVPSGCVQSFGMHVFRLGDEILVAGARGSSRGWPRRIGRPCL